MNASRPVGLIQVFGALGVAALAVALWVAWLGWDSEYQVDPVTGTATGPYEAWQVIGCGLSLLVLLVGALLAGIRPFAASAALTVAFTAAWTVSAAAQDDTGLYAVGTLLLAAGLAVGTTVVCLVTTALRRRPAR